jgi:hypothetical protein
LKVGGGNTTVACEIKAEDDGGSAVQRWCAGRRRCKVMFETDLEIFVMEKRICNFVVVLIFLK